MSKFDRLFVATASEHNHSLKFLNVGLFELVLLEEVDEEALQTLMCLACLKGCTLEHEDWFEVCMNVLWRLEFVCAFELLDTELKHVHNVTVEGSSEHEVIRALLLMATHSKETAVVLHCLVLEERYILHR